MDEGHMMLLIFMVMGWSFFLLILTVSYGYPNDIELVLKQIPCENLIEMDIYFETSNAQDFVKDECF